MTLKMTIDALDDVERTLYVDALYDPHPAAPEEAVEAGQGGSGGDRGQQGG